MMLRLSAFALSVSVALGCGGRRGSSGPPGPVPDAGTASSCATASAGTRLCAGETLVTCGNGGAVASSTDCLAMGQQCSPDLGCVTCRPGSRSCSGNASQLCSTDGSGYGAPEPCTGGLNCDGATGTCVDLCSLATSNNSYIGCEYWPTPVSNGVAPEFDFAVVVTNPQVVQAEVRVSRGGSPITSVTVAPGAVQTIRLPWVTALKAPSRPRAGGAMGQVEYMSAQVPNGAYKLTATVPVTVYQFNPLEYRITRDCADEPAGMGLDGQCFSFTNDASLLLPATVLTGDYMVMSWPTMFLKRTLVDRGGAPIIDPITGSATVLWSATPGYVAVVNVEATPVTVGITFAGHTQASTDRRVTAYRPGQTGNFTLQPGEVLQIASGEPPQSAAGCPSSSFSERQPFDCGLTPCELEVRYCDVGPDYDLTGSRITASGRVAVFSGHQCTFVPQHRWACDHLEEMMFPVESWGRDFLVSATQPLRSEPNVVRIVSGADGNALTFNPASVHGAATLAAGETIEFETSQDFQVTGSQAMLVGQFLVGQDYAGPATAGAMGNGDPALSLAVPTEQFRTSYAFLAPSTYEVSYVNITARVGQTVLLDGAPVSGWRPVGGTGMQTARVMVSGGAHSVNSGTAFGIVVYGFGSYTSYMYPGGLDFETINLI